MGAGNYSVEASVIENGKPVKGTLTLFIDEYAFGSTRKSVNWENVTCEQGTVRVKAFLRTVDKPSVIFCHGGERSIQYMLEPGQMDTLLAKVKEFADTVRNERLAKEEKLRKEEEEKQHQLAEEQRIRLESQRKAEEEYRRKQEEERRKKEEQERKEREAIERRIADKQARIKREVETCKSKSNEPISIEVISKKAGAAFLDNPYRILGVSCMATNEEANTALDKLKKLARLKVLESYRSAFDLSGLDKPVRNLSVAQNALTLLKDRTNKYFWFADADACAAWQSGKYRIELSREGEEFGTYDLFLANYMYAILCDPNFNVSETWKRILSFYCYIVKQPNCELLRSRFTEKELQSMSNADLLNGFKSVIFKPLLMLCDRDDLDAVIRLHKCIKDVDNNRLDNLSRSVLGKLVSWFTDKEAAMFTYLRDVADDEAITDEKGEEICQKGEAYCSVVEPVLEVVLRNFRGDLIRYDMIKESYRHTTYQLMYELNKCANKSNAILFANKCFSYCSADDKKRITNTFGEANIKSIDWNTPHTGWDVKGDDFYYGRGRAVNYTQALYWYHKAADAGNMYSPNSIGICYQKGHGVPQSDEQAVQWFEKAAKAGNPQGAYNLAECYFEGVGVRKSVDQALKYWAEAEKQGHPSAAQRRESVFATVQVERRNHRSRNHICHDIGFQMTTGPSMVVEVTVSPAGYAYLVNAQGYQNYLNGNDFKYYGVSRLSSSHRITIPSSNHWYVIVDNGDGPIAGITSSVKVKRA